MDLVHGDLSAIGKCRIHMSNRIMLDAYPSHMGDGHKVIEGTQTERLLEAGVLYLQNLVITAFNN